MERGRCGGREKVRKRKGRKEKENQWNAEFGVITKRAQVVSAAAVAAASTKNTHGEVDEQCRHHALSPSLSTHAPHFSRKRGEKSGISAHSTARNSGKRHAKADVPIHDPRVYTF